MPALADAPKQPNVIVIITDDQGYGDLSCHGNPVLKTPNLDRLHAESVRLTDFHVAPMCTPTRGQLLTGVDCLRNGAMNVSSGRSLLRRGIPTMADVFAAGGYRTGLFGKWHLGDNYPYRPQDRGFHEALSSRRRTSPRRPDYWNNDYFDDTYHHNGKREKYQGYCTDVFFDEAMRWMKGCAEASSRSSPTSPTNAPHGPLFVPGEVPRAVPGASKPNVARFFGMIANIDENVGRLDAFLARDRAARTNTILVFLTDNGGTAGVPVFNAGMRGPEDRPVRRRPPRAVLRPLAGRQAAASRATSTALTQVQDLLPTLIDLCGLTTPASAAVRRRQPGRAAARRGARSSPDRMLVVQFSRMNDPVPQKGDACVLWQRWRLVAGQGAVRPGRRPGAEGQRDREAPRRGGEDARTTTRRGGPGSSPKVNDHEAIVIGSDAENPLLLVAGRLGGLVPRPGAQVRAGLRRNGAWNVEVAKAGDYEIALRRWPDEADAPIRAGLPAVKHADGEFPAGVALPVATARLKVGEFDATRPVGAGDKAVTFAVKLAAGRTKLQTWFARRGRQGDRRGVLRHGPPPAVTASFPPASK